ncbi:MAG: hypothetical protein J6B85_01525 [Lachnospiraceae bacterium]|nr:hypothetical protein [Lachnospiraceae bacterium]
MSRQDTITKSYLSNAHIFADVFNYFLYEGQSVIDPIAAEHQPTLSKPGS